MNALFLIVLSSGLVGVSALCSGLNVALMSLDVADLRRRAKIGESDAKIALAIRKNTHLSLASILLANVAVISATSLVLSSVLNGFIAGAISTVVIVIFGEILPQAFAVKHSLRAIAIFAPFLRLLIIISYPFSRPLQFLLDRLVGSEDRRFHSRRELGLIIGDHHDENRSELDDDEVEIAQNALQLSNKRVKEIMMPIKDVYYLKETDMIDANRINDLKRENWSRIPIFNSSVSDGERFLLLKDLVDIDFDERPYKLSELKTHKALSVGSMTALDTMFRKFIAAKSHMMIVKKGKKVVGVVTIEDLIEEILGHEIEDETDVEKANRG